MSDTRPTYSLAEIAASLGLTAVGDTALRVSGVAEPALAGPDQIALAMKPDYAAALSQGQARAAMLWDGADWKSYGLKGAILSPRPRHALSGLSAMMDPGQGYAPGIHPSAIVEDGAVLGEDVSVGPFAYIAAGARVGAGSVIAGHVHVGRDVTLGEGALIHVGARLMAGVTAGARLIVQPGAVIGGDGYSFVTPEVSGVERARASLGRDTGAASQPWARIHSLGAVTLGDDVEVGANSTIDRGTVRDTIVGSGTKIDSLVQVGHNVVVGRDVLLCAQVGLAGTSTIGDGAVLGGKSGVSDNTNIGAGAILGGATIALSNVPPGRVMLGYPAMKMDTQIEVTKGLRRLPRLFREVADLKAAMARLRGSD
ncbi:UDP-3-O-(3-hydroxymyristoyl)glucosamine N-acyltransferase [Thetidibacter halocola]|uniref:UDP-3-O-(3-hydroxymyristoyl)glucosamine N-acyltransferase n=1 Tax=Thetidibacter halocola TaxID=2827239 RepID=A0A8J7WBA4_9RHOB|nr:UDP-3-O-(3-hydroxymyristoyl)glucosamine N-acyltransferase [Thetidibacter halocola]MBS0124385.1 UDP-3-O-(3-hydroxymyristoyl)glucosamine N-acyltransferase [Thetidibacter halocola]